MKLLLGTMVGCSCGVTLNSFLLKKNKIMVEWVFNPKDHNPENARKSQSTRTKLFGRRQSNVRV